jgi:hypothetical protein
MAFSHCPCYQHKTLISAPRTSARWTISVGGWWQGHYEKGHVLIYLSHILPGQITCYCPRKIILPRRQITRRKLCFYYTYKFGVISIKYVIVHGFMLQIIYTTVLRVKHLSNITLRVRLFNCLTWRTVMWILLI